MTRRMVFTISGASKSYDDFDDPAINWSLIMSISYDWTDGAD